MEKCELEPAIPSPMSGGEIVWHYTGTAGLQGILEAKALWASSPQVLNDLSEIGYGENVVREVWESLREENLPDLGRSHLDLVLGMRGPSGVLEVSDPAKAVRYNFRDELSSSIFIASASRDSDLLNQWAHYGGEAGFAVGLQTSSLLTINGDYHEWTIFEQTNDVREGWYRVIYDKEEQQELAERALRYCVEKSVEVSDSESELETMEIDRFLLRTLIAQMKHPAFKAEKEARYIATLPPGEKPKFRPAPDRLIPYVSLAPGPRDRFGNDNMHMEEMITAITVGPSARQGTAEVVERLLASQELANVAVYDSKIPYLANRR